jgi:hypothetical protein
MVRLLASLPHIRAARVSRVIALGFVCAFLALAAAAFAAESEWAHPGPDGKLVYKTTPTGDRILDFSHAGYMGGGVVLPTDVPVKATVQPLGNGNDDAPAIQAAINLVSTMPLVNGFRGAVQLAPGSFTCYSSISILASGIVVRGSGSGIDGQDKANITTIHMAGPAHRAILIGRDRAGTRPRGEERPPTAPPLNEPEGLEATTGPAEPELMEGERNVRVVVTDAYIPAGSNQISVSDARGFAAGQTIAIRRPTTPAWVHFMGMDTMRRDGRKQTWIGTTRAELVQRTITAIDGKRLTLDIPLPDSYDASLLNPPGVTAWHTSASQPGAVHNVGVEHLHIQCPPLEIDYGHAPYSAIRVSGEDCWVRDVFCEETMNATVLAGRRITMENVVVTHTFANLGASKPSDFSIEDTEILIDRCRITGDNEYFVWTTSLEPGPNVLLNCTFRGRGSHIQPHQRWSTGLLVDNCSVADGRIDFMNRGVAGSGHGWTMGWAVAWNCVADGYTIQSPPGVMNWAIGCIGERQQIARLFDTTPVLPEGTFESHGTPVTPQSLYLVQLSQRLGEQAIHNIGYPANDVASFSNKSVARLPAWPRDDDPVLGPDLALHRPVNTSSVRKAALHADGSREFGGECAIDGDDKTYWSPTDSSAREEDGRSGSARGPRAATLEIDMEGPVRINALSLGEAAGFEQHVQAYKVEGQVDSDWQLLSEGTTIGQLKTDRFADTTVWKVRLTIAKSQGQVAIRKVALYDHHVPNPAK